MNEQQDSARIYVLRIPETSINKALCEHCHVSPEQLMKKQLEPILNRDDSAQRHQQNETIQKKEITITLG